MMTDKKDPPKAGEAKQNEGIPGSAGGDMPIGGAASPPVDPPPLDPPTGTAPIAAEIGRYDGDAGELDRLEKGLVERGQTVMAGPVDDALAAIDMLVEQLAAAPAKNGRRTTRGVAHEKPRRIGVAKGEEVAQDPQELLGKIMAADQVEIAFSDGENEVAGLAPVMVWGHAHWQITGAGLLLRGDEVKLHGPAYGEAPFSIAGYGLILDDKLVAYRARPDVLRVGPNQSVKLVDDIVF